MQNVYAADHHLVTRLGLKHLLAQTGRYAVAAEFSEFSGLLAQTRTRLPNLVITELSLPGGGSLEGLKDFTREFPSVPTLVFTHFEASQYALRALKAGARGFLCKSASAAELVQALDTLQRGETFFSEATAPLQALVKFPRSRASDLPHETLSNREFDVLLMIARGTPLKAVAEKLQLSTKTISTYRHRILTKFAMRSNADLVEYVLKHGL